MALVTGATGFIGRHLIRYLSERGIQCHCIYRPGRLPKLFETWVDAQYLQPVWHAYSGCIEDIQKVIHESGSDTVFHLAAMPQYKHSPSELESMVRVHLLLGSQILEALSHLETEKRPLFINTGTFWADERDGCPMCLYAAMKQAFESIIHYYCQTNRIGAVTLRLYDTYGTDDSRAKIISLMLHAAESNVTLDMSPGDQKINLVHVQDVVRAYYQALHLLLKDDSISYQVFDVRAHSSISLKRLSEIVSDVVKKKVPVRWGAKPYREREIMEHRQKHPVLEGWQPEIDLEQGIASMINIKL